EALQSHAEVAANHLREFVGLTFEGKRPSLPLFVVLQLHLVEAGEPDADPGGAGDRHRRELVGAAQLVQVAVGDDIALSGPTVTCKDHAPGEGQGDDGRRVRGEVLGPTGGGGKVVSGQQLGTDRTEELGEGRGSRTHVSAGQPSTLKPFEHATPFMYAPPPS